MNLFVENVGQLDPRIRFQVFGGGPRLQLTDDALWLTLVEAKSPDVQRRLGIGIPTPLPRSAVHLRLSFAGSNAEARPRPLQRLPTVVSYLRGASAKLWHREVPVWSGVVYDDLYQGISFRIERGLAWGVEAKPDVPLDAFRLRIEGAERVTVHDRLRLDTLLGPVFLPLLTVDPPRKSSLCVEPAGVQVFDVRIR